MLEVGEVLLGPQLWAGEPRGPQISLGATRISPRTLGMLKISSGVHDAKLSANKSSLLSHRLIILPLKTTSHLHEVATQVPRESL